MAGKFKIMDKHLAFANDVAAGMDAYKAYQAHIGKKCNKSTASVNASGLIKREEIKALIQKARDAREKAIIRANAESLPPEFTTAVLTIDQIDNFHYAVLKGMVEVEEIFPVVTITKDEHGKEVGRTTALHRVKRKANIRERQASADAIYKRFGSYAPTKMLGAFGKVNEEGEIENVERFVLLSSGERVPL